MVIHLLSYQLEKSLNLFSNQSIHSLSSKSNKLMFNLICKQIDSIWDGFVDRLLINF